MSTRIHLGLVCLAIAPACFNPASSSDETPGTLGASTGVSSGQASSSPTGEGSVDTGSAAGGSTAADATADDGSTVGGSSSASTGEPPSCSPPELLGSYPTASQTLGVAVWGNRAFSTHTNAGLIVLDISDPTNPTQLAQIPVPNPQAVAVVGDDVYVGDPTGLYHIDAVSLSVVSSISSVANRMVGGVAVADGLVYYTDNDNGNTCDACGLHIIDGALTAELSSLALGEDPRGVAVDGTHAFVADGLGGLVVVDVGDPNAPVAVAQMPLAGWAGDVAVADGRAYVANGGVTIFDVSTPAAPAQLGTIAGTISFAVAIQGNWLWVTDQDPGVRVIDVGDPLAPVELGALADFTAGGGVAANEDLAIVGSFDHGVNLVAPPTCG